ncbi:MAG TPA: hypothetical protein VN222_14960 [Novosphingobium sp.]|nr:hypothetical protein [Novosphingobium sp.]
MRLLFGLAALVAAAPALWGTSASAQAAAPAAARGDACDRACLRGKADALLASIVAHDPGRLPLARTYRATENGVPAALPMMTIWRTATAAAHTFHVIDPVSQQVLLVSDIAEGSSHALLFGRIRVAQGQISEIELYVDRSRSDGGFQFEATGLAQLPSAWTQQVAPARLPTRDALLVAGRSIFDTRLSGPEAAPSCVMMENGKPVAEDPEVLKVIGGGGPELAHNADGSVPIPCGAPPFRPTDPDARTDIVDEAQGIVVSIGTMEGLVQPYVITAPTISAFVPDAMMQPYLDLLAAQRKTGRFNRPELVPTRASITVVQMQRYYDGKLQGMHLLEKLGPVGARSPWTAKNP